MALRLIRARVSGLPGPLLLLLILGVALGLRLHGIDWDSGYGFHPDERSLYLRADCMYDVLTHGPGYPTCVTEYPRTEPGWPGPGVLLDAQRSPLNPHWFPLGSVLIYVLVLSRAVLELFTDLNGFDLRYLGRGLSALADVGSVWLVFQLGCRAYGRRVGLLAAALTALAVIHIQNSHFYRPETFSVFLALASFWAMLRMLERRRLRDSLLLGLLVGLAMAPKVSVLPLGLPLLLAYAYRTADAARERGAGVTLAAAVESLAHAALAGLVAVSAFFLLTPYALLDFRSFIGDLAAQANMARHAGLWPFTLQYLDTPPFLYQFHQTAVWGLGLPLGLAAWSGILATAALAWRRRENRRADLLLLAWVVPSMLFLESFEVRFQRYFFPLMPFMILMASRTLVWLVDYFRSAVAMPAGEAADRPAGWTGLWRGWWSRPPVRKFLARCSVALVVVVVVATACHALAFQRVYAREHPALAASRWIQANVPAGTELVSDNHWDEYIPDLYRYRVWQFPVYEPDGFEKMETLARHLADAEYIVFYSNRPYGSVARAPERYPLSASYYQQLFRGELGYQLERAFTSYPGLPGLSLRDDPFGRAGLPRPEPLVASPAAPIELDLGYADDNVVGYDHPQVLLFRNVDRLPADRLLLRLAGAGAAQQSRPPVGLLLSEEQKARQRSGGTWSRIVDRDGWASRVPALTWLLAVELFYLTALPLALFIFRPLPDRGLVLARPLGLLLAGYLTWLAVSLGWLDFSRIAILLGLLAVAALSGAVLAGHWREIRDFLARRWPLLLTGEALFLVAFLALVALRAANPDLWHPYRGGEKPMELAYLNAVLRSTTMPPYDPWFSGGYLNYYYWGYFIVSLPLKLTRLVPTTAFNLAVPMFFALTVSGAYSVVYNLAEGVRRSRNSGDAAGADSQSPAAAAAPGTRLSRWRRVPGSPVAAGITAGLFTAVMGNLDGVVQLAQGVWRRVTEPGAGFPPFDFWRSSRMLPPLENFDPGPLAFWVPEKVPGAADVSWHITEFPFFTFLFADLHAHMMVIPFTLLLTGLGLNLVAGLAGGGKVWLGAALLALALALGALWPINSWDYPSYLALVVALVALAVYLAPGSGTRRLLGFGALTLLIVGASWLAFLPFHQSYETFDAGMSASRWRTPLDRYLGIHGLFLFVVVTYLLYCLGRPLAQLLASIRRRPGSDPASTDHPGQLLGLGLAALLVVFLAAAGYWTGAFLLALVALTGLAAWRLLAAAGPDRAYTVTPLLLLGLALGIGIGVDLARLQGDIGRMNTMFKYYLEGWVLFSLAASYFLWRLGAAGWFRRWNWGKAAWVGLLALLVGSSLIYTALGTRSRLADRFNDGPLTLDGTAYMGQAVHWEKDQPLELQWDRAAIQWLEDNVAGSPVVLEAHTDQYRWGGRIASYTGLPTVLGWPWHQIQQRTAYAFAVSDRSRAVREIYETEDPDRAEALLRQYEVSYVMVGQLERVWYPGEGLVKFDRWVEEGRARLVYQNPGVTVYQTAW